MDLVTVERERGMLFTIALRDHRITTDMSAADGGEDGGCTPVELMTASVGGCLAVMVQRYCDERGFTDGDVSVSLVAEMADSPNRIKRFVADVELPADVPERERVKLKTVVRQLPVPATLREVPEVMVEFT